MSWNVRGLNGLNKQREVKLLCNELELGIMCFIETRIKVHKVGSVVEGMFGGWEYRSNHAAHYNGRLLLVWRKDWFDVVIESEAAQAMTCQITCLSRQLRFNATFVYAFNQKEERKELWNYIMQLNLRSGPWVVLGDFNAVLHAEDRIGGTQVTYAEIVDFQHCLDTCGLVELPTNGGKYTWTDNQDERIFSRIDWVFVNGEWMDDMPDCRANILPAGVSDHCPIVVQMVKCIKKKRRAFKLRQCLVSTSDFHKVVEHGWCTDIAGYKMFQVVQKLKMLKSNLKQLHRQHFSNIVQEQEETSLRPKYRQSAKLSEMFLIQRSKATWIKLGDDNTKYFFAIIKQRKLAQSVCQIQDEQSQVQHEQDKITAVFVRYYQQLLREHGGPRRKAYPGFFNQGPKLSMEQQCRLRAFLRKR
ncbi:uncharacterized protein LOC132041992 [Lycium ferocissimum]|uniref:uncharacterized protein LOC132041992 n=1 Tax=Lycium ferocissimum TaxID=112874 RepID=UPI002814C9FC|nr:uncharacterized protein LOC132041992 [Lycium ferocissimum]